MTRFWNQQEKILNSYAQGCKGRHACNKQIGNISREIETIKKT